MVEKKGMCGIRSKFTEGSHRLACHLSWRCVDNAVYSGPWAGARLVMPAFNAAKRGSECAVEARVSRAVQNGVDSMLFSRDNN